MALILAEPSYSKSIWGNNLIRGLTKELRYKRIPYRIIYSMKDANKHERYIFLISSSSRWINTALSQCRERHLYPILLCSQAYLMPNAAYSMVCSDIRGMMRQLVAALHNAGRNHVALYGVNPYSISDEARKRCFLEATCELREGDIFYNNDSNANCFQHFLKCASDYDAVICTNDFAAVSLVRHLKESSPDILENIVIIGCAEGKLARHYNQYIYSVTLNYSEFGRAAVDLLRMLNNLSVSGTVVWMKWNCDDLEKLKTNERKFHPVTPMSTETDQNDIFYMDNELCEMMLIERLLDNAEQIDFVILREMRLGESYEKIAEKCYVTEGTVKYRIRKMEDICQVDDRRSFTALLDKYL